MRDAASIDTTPSVGVQAKHVLSALHRRVRDGGSDRVGTLVVQGVFLFTGVFSTCAAQYVFYQGAGDQKVMLLPLCNYLGMMLVGLMPATFMGGAGGSTSHGKSASSSNPSEPHESDSLAIKPIADTTMAVDLEERDEPERTRQPTGDDAVERRRPHHGARSPELTALTHRQASDVSLDDTDHLASDWDTATSEISPVSSLTSTSTLPVTSSESAANTASSSLPSVSLSLSAVQVCILLSVVLDFAGCIFSNMGLAMAGSGLYQVVYSSVICWSALLSRFVLKKVVSKEEWMGIALVTFGLAFSALGEAGHGRNNYVVLMGCFNTLVGAAFYGGNYVTGEYTLKLPERPQPKELCLKIGAACLTVIAVYQIVFVLPSWHALVTKPIEEAKGNSTFILLALVGYTMSQLAHGLTYFLMLGSSGAVTTGIMQSLRAVCVFVISSVLYCSQQESQCFDTKRGVATLIVVSGVLFYSWAKSNATKVPVAPPVQRRKAKVVKGKNFVV